MIRLSGKMPIFVPWFRKNPRHRGERLSFDPSENLENSKYAGEKSESCFSCSSIYTACSHVESAHVNTCRCELISFLRTQVLQRSATKETLSKRNRRKNFLAKNARRLTLYVYSGISTTKKIK